MNRVPLAATSCSIVFAVVLVGCGAARPNGVFAVKNGMTKQQVQKIAGTPYRAGQNCWLYHASKKNTSIDGMRFCFTNGRVSLVQTAVHG